MVGWGRVREPGARARNTSAEGRAWWEAEREHPKAGARTYAYTYTHAVPLMRRWGFTDEHLHTFLVDNPRRMFRSTRI